MSDLPNKVIAVFLDKQVHSLKDSEISQAIHSQGIKCFPDTIRRIAQQLSPSLFRLSNDRDNSMTIIVEPKLEICSAFLAGQCHLKIKPCDKLHICRDFGHCKKKPCRFPHDLYHGQNETILEENHCRTIDSQLLIRLLRMNKTVKRSESYTSTATQRNRDPPKIDDIERQIDVGYPSKQLAEHIDMEIIEIMLNTRSIEIEKKLNECENEFFRRGTIQLVRIEDIDKVLQEPIVYCEKVNVKFKRTKQFVDQSSFQLRISLLNPSENLADSRIRLYIEFLIGKDNSFQLYNFSTIDEQIFLVQCQKNLDFNELRQKYQSRRTLSDHEIRINQIYECDQVKIAFQDYKKSMDFHHIERIVPLAQEKIFTFETIEPHAVDIEFINTQACKQWMLISDRMKTKFEVVVTPMMSVVEENEPIVSNSTALKRTKITLRSDWAMVAHHSVFGKEYRDYMHEQLGGELEINGDEVVFIGDIPRMPRCPNDVSVVVNKTNNYMQKFRYQTFRDLKPFHLRTLRLNANIVAFSRRNEHDYVVAARPQDLIELKRKLFPKSKQSEQIYSSTEILPLMQQESVGKPIPPSTTTKPDLVSSSYAVNTSEYLSMFTIDSFEERLRKYLQDKFHVKVNIERSTTVDKNNAEKSRVLIKFNGQQTDVDNVTEELMNIFTDLKTRKYDDTKDGNWVKLDEAIDILRHHLSLKNLTCSIQRTSSTSIQINYFDRIVSEFGVDDDQIDEIVNKQFSSATISLTQQMLSDKLQSELKNLQDIIQAHENYRKDICLAKEDQSIYLFGLTKLVKEYQQLFKQLTNKFISQTCKLKLSERQIRYLFQVARNEVNKLAEQYEKDGCDLSLARLVKTGDFLAPSDLHSVIKDKLLALVDLDELTFEIENNAFAQLIKEKPERLATALKSKCCYETKEKTKATEIFIPNARATDLEQQAAPAATPSPPQFCTAVNVNKSTLRIVLGDLTTQKVDVIVVCYTSEILRNAIINTAGAQVRTEFETCLKINQQSIATSNGTLPCKKILFLPCKVDQSNPSLLQGSLEKFVSVAIQFAVDNNYQTLAFPSVGCGKLGFDPAIIAQYMISAALKDVNVCKSKLEISFVLVPSQKNVYDEFVKYLSTLRKQPASATPPTNRQSKMSYEEKIVQITLISANKNSLNKHKAAIIELANSCVSTVQLKGADMMDWSQKTINAYYELCLKSLVKPIFNIDTCILDLTGPKDAVQEAERNFYQLTSEACKEARIHAVARNVVWSVETTPNSNTWEQYSYKLNGLIEDAKLKRHAHIDFMNDKQERCRIVFDTMQEQHEMNTRRVRRIVVDSLIPEKWDPSDQNCSRITLQPTSQEYLDVLKQFDTTMTKHYHQIIKIERIQNIRWYKQYAAHRDDHQQKYGKLDERLLFHGCVADSANKIIQECFNRSFAGVNGVVYGCGVYFHSHASYSHAYAKLNPSTNERTIFLARVLIGKTTIGNQSMKTLPAGYDTTTDGQHIFVVYHDAGAYADYLITYK